MEVRGFLQNPRFFRASKHYFALVVTLLILNMPFIVGERIFWYSNNLLPPLLALVTSFLFFRARAMVKDPDFRLLWRSMGLGFGLWGIADFIWAIYAVVLQQEIPNPSIADLLWAAGYFPIFLGLILRLRTTARELSRWQIGLMVIVSLACLAGGYFWGIAPLIAAYDPTQWMASAVSLFYAVGDLGLVILSSVILIMLKGGRYNLSWRLIFAGIFTMTISDILFTNASLQGMYYPDGHVNLITFLADTSYLVAYLSAGFGVFLHTWTWEIRETFPMKLVITPSSKYFAFIATNAENRVILASNNIYCLINASETDSFYKMSLGQVLGLDAAQMQLLLDKLISNGSVYNAPVHLKTWNGSENQALLTAIAIYDPGEHSFAGASIVLQSNIALTDELRMPKSQELARMLKHTLAVTNPHSTDESQAIGDYFLETIRLYSAMLYQHGGRMLQTAFMDVLNAESQRRNLPVRVDEQVINISEDFQGENLAVILTPLLQTARRFVSNDIGEQIVKDKLNELEKQLTKDHLNAVKKYQ